MADEPQVIRGIDWRSTFPFTLIFRSFRVAIHPSKLFLALLALVLIYGGGRLLDGVWNLWPAYRAVPNEMLIYERSRDASGLRWWSTYEAAWMNVTLFDRAAARLSVGSVRELSIDDATVMEATEFLGLISARRPRVS